MIRMNRTKRNMTSWGLKLVGVWEDSECYYGKVVDALGYGIVGTHLCTIFVLTVERSSAKCSVPLSLEGAPFPLVRL